VNRFQRMALLRGDDDNQQERHPSIPCPQAPKPGKQKGERWGSPLNLFRSNLRQPRQYIMVAPTCQTRFRALSQASLSEQSR
jgi:hypothetical protein